MKQSEFDEKQKDTQAKETEKEIDHSQETDALNEDYQFVKEKIKEKPFFSRKTWNSLLFMVLGGVVVGLIACFTFVLAKPHMEKLFFPDENEVVVIPPDDMDSAIGEDESAQPEDTAFDEDAEPETVYITEKQTMSLEEYQQLQYQLYNIGKKANQYVVTVTSVSNESDWFSTYEKRGVGTGVIFLKSSSELMILTEKKNIADAETIHITFQNGEKADAQLKQYDTSTGLAVLSVALGDLSEDMQGSVAAAELGNSYQVIPGTMVLAIGSPMGENYSILYGNVTRTSAKRHVWDGVYTMFNTDILASGDGSGVLIDLDGKIVGIILPVENEAGSNTVTALSVSELKKLIENLSNGTVVPYLGVKISTVTDTIAQENNLPVGVYVGEVNADSPAMKAGIQDGDVIVQIDGEDVLTEATFMEKMLSHKPEDKITIAVMRMGADGQYQEVSCEAVLQQSN